jgi:cytochrome P450
VINKIQEEQEEIKREKEEAEEERRTLEWADLKLMPVTCRVIHETMRVASILSFTFREAVQDVEYEGRI